MSRTVLEMDERGRRQAARELASVEAGSPWDLNLMRYRQEQEALAFWRPDPARAVDWVTAYRVNGELRFYSKDF